MSLSRFESPSRRDDSRFILTLDDESRDYIEQQAGVDTALPDLYCDAMHDGLRCRLSPGHYPALAHTAMGVLWRDEP